MNFVRQEGAILTLPWGFVLRRGFAQICWSKEYMEQRIKRCVFGLKSDGLQAIPFSVPRDLPDGQAHLNVTRNTWVLFG